MNRKIKINIIVILSITSCLLLFYNQLHSQTDQTDKWWKYTNIFQIYPRSFTDSNNDGIGDIQGIISNLDYLHDLGFETIWVSPFFESPQQDFGYDISNYYTIDTIFGNIHDVEQLIDEVHQRKMFIVFDLVLNHTSNQHEWFKESVEKINNKTDWYIWKNGRGKRPPNNWKSLTGPNGWHFNETRKQWYWASFLDFQPDLNWRNPDVKKAMFDVVRFWLEKGVDGFRLDIFNVIYEDSTFKNNPRKINPFPTDESPSAGFQELRYSMNHPDNYQLALELRNLVNEYDNPSRFLIGEVFGPHKEISKFLGEDEDGLNLIFLFDMKRFRFNADFFKKQLLKYESFYSEPKVPVYAYSNHDDRRSISRIKGNIQKAKLLALFQMTTRGVAVTYQGEEFGMSDAKIPRKKAKDPLAKLYKLPQCIVNILPLLINRDECRTPVQWNSKENAGFTKPGIETWLPVNKNYKTVNVENALNDSNSLIYTYKQLLRLRKETLCLKYGTVEIIKNKKFPGKVLAYKRKYKNEELLILINFTNKELKIELPEVFSKIVYNTHDEKLTPVNTFAIKPLQGLILKR